MFNATILPLLISPLPSDRRRDLMTEKGVPRRQISELEKLAIHRETLKREKKFETFREEFNPNPKSIYILPENPMRARRDSPRDVEDGFTETVLQTLRSTTQVPAEKYELPMTTSQEVGFWTSLASVGGTTRTISSEIKPMKSRFHYPQQSSEITKYAELVVQATKGSKKEKSEGVSKK